VTRAGTAYELTDAAAELGSQVRDPQQFVVHSYLDRGLRRGLSIMASAMMRPTPPKATDYRTL